LRTFEQQIARFSVRHIVCPSCGAVNRVPTTRPAREAKCGSCHHALFEGKPIAADGDTFERHIRRNDIPVVVDFWAPWCVPCRAMAPALERAASELGRNYRVLKVNTEEVPELAARYAIRSIPTLILLAGSRKVDQIAGAMDTPQIVAWVQSHTPPQP
jgi:thioredoxin 2